MLYLLDRSSSRPPSSIRDTVSLHVHMHVSLDDRETHRVRVGVLIFLVFSEYASRALNGAFTGTESTSEYISDIPLA
jgi:hypothetical protein